MKQLTVKVSQSPVTSARFIPNQNMGFKHLQCIFSIYGETLSFTLYETTDKTVVLYILILKQLNKRSKGKRF
jgi:hypothetical protein